LNGKDAVFEYIRPTQHKIPIIFSQIRIIKTSKAGQLKPTFTIHMTPIKADPFLSPEQSRISITDFTETTFEIQFDTKASMSHFNWGM